MTQKGLMVVEHFPFVFAALQHGKVVSKVCDLLVVLQVEVPIRNKETPTQWVVPPVREECGAELHINAVICHMHTSA